MKLKTLFTMCLAVTLATSCIKEEGSDREADIVSISIDDEGYLGDVIDEQTKEISLVMEGDVAKYKNGTITPKIEVSRGATVSPASLVTTTLDDYKARYTVTAEDGGIKTYNVTVMKYAPLVQDFENWRIITVGKADPKDNLYYEQPVDPMWTNANEGVAILYKPNTPFPTRSSKEDAYAGSDSKTALVLETVFGNESSQDIMDIPVYAGNMFRGKFEVRDALRDPLSTTLFGQPHPKYLGKALALVLQYKYKSGDTYVTYEKVNGRKVIEKIPNRQRLDKPDMYAVLYKVTKGERGREEYLTAHDIKTSDKIVSTAFLDDQTEKENWTLLESKFTYEEELDFGKYDYKLAVVLTSSEDGKDYKGALGSKLIIDDLRIVCEADDDAYLYK